MFILSIPGRKELLNIKESDRFPAVNAG